MALAISRLKLTEPDPIIASITTRPAVRLTLTAPDVAMLMACRMVFALATVTVPVDVNAVSVFETALVIVSVPVDAIDTALAIDL